MRLLLESQGWWVARAAGSLGDADLVALRARGTPMLIEVKSTESCYDGFPPAVRMKLIAAAERAGAEAWLAWWPKGGSLRWFPPPSWPSTPMNEEA